MAPRRTYGSIEITREDIRPMVRRMAQHMVDTAEANERKFKEQEGKWKYDTVESLWCRIERVDARIESQPKRYKGTILTGLPKDGMEVTAEADNPDSVLRELRYRFAHAVHGSKLVKTWDEARARAAKAQFFIADLVE